MNPHGVRIELNQLCRHHKKGASLLKVLQDVTLTIEPGEMVAVVGASGSGKSTLMHLLGLLDRPTSGTILLDGESVDSLSNRVRARLRNLRIGYVFQSHQLLPDHTALQNVAIPVRLSGSSQGIATTRAGALLDAVGLSARTDHLPGEMSGGEQQRVALARALVMGPGLILADEPTGNLDPTTAGGVFELMLQLNKSLGSTLIVVTHSMDLAARFPRVLTLHHGSVSETS